MQNEESKIDENINPIIFNDKKNKLIDSKDFYFNYRNDESFNRINILETKPLNKNYNYENYFTFNPQLNYNSIKLMRNEYSYQIDTKNENIYNNKVKDIKYNELKSSINSINSMKMREISEEEKEIQNQIKYEETILKNLKEEKNKLIEEEKKRRDMIFIEINNNKNKMEEKKEEIKEILYECKKEKKDLKINENKNLNFNMPNKNYYYNDYLQQTKEKKELFNKNSNKMIKKDIKKEKNYKKITKINSNHNDKYPLKINLSYNNINSLRRVKKEITDKINLKSYFQLSEKEKKKKFNYTSTDNLIKNCALNERKKIMNLTPVGLYRTYTTDNLKNSPKKVYKTLSSNKNNNFMTQTRFYRSRINPDELISNYAKEKAIKINSSRNKSFIHDSSIYNFQKINYNNFRTNQPRTPLNLINRNQNKKNCYKSPFEKIYFNYGNNLDNSKYNMNSIEKKESEFVEINYNDNKTTYLCDNCLREKMLFNGN